MPWALPVTLVLTVLLSCLTLWTLAGNALVLAALIKFPALRSAPNLLIGNLAISDFLLALTVLPLSSVNDVMGHWQFGSVLCNLWLSLDVLYCTASVWSLVAIAFDRFTATVFPLWYREKQQRCRAGLYSVLVWLLSSIICLPPLIGWDGHSFVDPVAKLGRSLVRLGNTSKVRCDLFKETNYVVYSATGSFILPLVILILLYARILFLLQLRARKLRRNRMSRQRRRLLVASRRQLQQHQQLAQEDIMEMATVVAPTRAEGEDAEEEEEEQDGLSQHEGDSLVQQMAYNNNDDDDDCDAEEEVNKDVAVGTNCCIVVENPATTAAGGGTVGTVAGTVGTSAAEFEEPTTTRQQQQQQQQQQRRHVRAADLREQRATQRMLVIIVVFIVCWMPFTLMYLIRGVGSSSSSGTSVPPTAAGLTAGEVLQMLAIWLGYVNSAVNPILYTVFNRDFRRAMQKLVAPLRCNHCYYLCRCGTCTCNCWKTSESI